MISRWPQPFTEHESVERFIHSTLNSGVHAILINKAKLYILLRLRSSQNLIVFFNGSVKRSTNIKYFDPFFSGVRITEALDANFLAIDDPCLQLSPDLNLAWYAGSKYFDLIQSICAVINYVVYKTQSTNIVLCGGSGGGFASLLYASQIRPSIAISVNPQTNILRYYRRFRERFASVCFEWDNKTDISESLGLRYRLSDTFVESGIPAGFYIQNTSDPHVQDHAVPLLKALGGIPKPVDQAVGPLNFIFRSWGEGHSPLPPEVYLACLNELCIVSSETALQRVIKHFDKFNNAEI